MTTNNPEIRQLIAKLKAPFAPEDHEIRDLPGRGQWVFLKWQKYRDRLDDVSPDWEVCYGEPVFQDKYCVISCTITIAGVKRQTFGTVESEPKGARGSAIDRAIAEAFKNCCESFGIAQYLDDQPMAVQLMLQSSNEKDREAVRAYARNLKVSEGNYKRPSAKEDKQSPSLLQNGYKPVPKDDADVLTPNVDRKMVYDEIRSLARRKNLSDDAVHKGCVKYYNKQMKDLTDNELISYRDRISLYTPA